MKKLYFLASIILLSFTVFAQNPVPNPGFETWPGLNPDSWVTNNAGANAPVTKVSPGYSSTNAAKLTAIVIAGQGTVVPILLSASSGFPVTHAYSNLEFWYKADFLGFDACNITVSFTNAGGASIGGGFMRISSDKSSFTHVTVPLSTPSGTPAKCTIAFSVQDTVGPLVASQGSSITIDNVQLTGVIGIDELKDGSDLVVFPNPVQQRMEMQVTTSPGEKITWKLMDLSGRIVAEKKAAIVSVAELKDEMILPELAKGLYVLSMESDIRRATRRVAVQ
ncbi:MAG TPA: T9SS type A sorting domain-containing protein [Bacteroidia bacterium]|nr:T9SS type A sorting domain-containing protein [Bacteroidia bacterium]